MEGRAGTRVIPHVLDTNAVLNWLRKAGTRSIEKEFAVTTFTAIEFPVVLTFPNAVIVQPTTETYLKSIKYSGKLRDLGAPVPAVDIIIAAIVVEKGSTLVSDDAHFAAISAMEPKLTKIGLEAYLSKKE